MENDFFNLIIKNEIFFGIVFVYFSLNFFFIILGIIEEFENYDYIGINEFTWKNFFIYARSLLFILFLGTAFLVFLFIIDCFKELREKFKNE